MKAYKDSPLPPPPQRVLCVTPRGLRRGCGAIHTVAYGKGGDRHVSHRPTIAASRAVPR